MHWIALQPLPDPLLESPAGAGVGVSGGTPPDSAPALVDALAALGWWALQFTPKVAQVQGALVMEVSASERLFGGRKALLEKILKEKRPVAHMERARAATSLIALARLQLSASAPRQPDALPLTTLAAAQPHLPTLARIGCTTWGQLRALPRGGVVRRFGAELLDALDRAFGVKPELYPWLALPEVFFAKLELTARIDNAPALMFGARRLLAQLHVWLQARQRGILALELGWELDARRQDASAGQLVLRTAVPTLDMGHLQRLLAENLARITLHAPALYLHLRSLETATLPGATASLLPDEVRAGDSLHHLLERLSARLGADHVLRVVPHADHRPERMQVWQPASGIAASALLAKPDALYPTWLLTPPLKLPVHNNLPHCADDGNPLTLLAGPQRLEAGWWIGQKGLDAVVNQGGSQGGDVPPAASSSPCALRDYFLARSAQMGLLWVYQERLGGQGSAQRKAGTGADWYLHGLFA